MIHRLRAILPGKIFRGSAPSPKDVLWLKNMLGVKKIVSLDKESGDKIDRTCKLLNIEHVKVYIDGANKKSLLHALSHNLKHLLLDGGPTYLHCQEGKDRTGLVSALFKCEYMGMDPNKAIEEAKSLGFGIGLPPQITHLYEKIIRSCKPATDSDINQANIVDNTREYVGDNRDSFLDEANRGSFAPYLDHTRQYPADYTYNFINDQSPTRENYRSSNQQTQQIDPNETDIPLVGIYNNDAGIHGSGPTEPVGGFLYDQAHFVP